MNAKKLNIILIAALIVLAAVIVYQNFISSEGSSASNIETSEEQQLWTCGMHPEIISDEPGNCPICGMKLTPVKNTTKSSGGEREILYWVAPMDPTEIYDKPGKSKMGMDLVPVYADQAAPNGVVTIDPAVQQTMNVKFTTIKKDKLDPSIETNAVITTDERQERQINARFGGWIEKLYINYTGQQVTKGEKLLEIYSPELVAAQQEYLTALQYKNNIGSNSNSSVAQSGIELLKNARKKLELLKMTSTEIDALEKTDQVKTTIPLYSPVSGTVLNKNVIEGDKINAGQNLLLIADLSTLWIKADLYESDINNIHVGDPATIKVNAYPANQFEGKVSFIYPTISPETRTVQARIDVANKDSKLKPSMLANVYISSKGIDEALIIPETAVIRSGQNNVAVLYLGDGKFKPVQLKLGQYSNGNYQVLSGLTEGAKVVTSAQFLIDSESSLKSAMSNFTEGSSTETTKTETGTESKLIRHGVIDLEQIDANKDGKVYQCPMDWDVLSDEPGKCPECEMKLKEVTLEEARTNLLNNGYQAKELKTNKAQDSAEHKTEASNKYGVESEFIRTGVIDLESLDKNGDGKLFECPMDWNVIDDEYHRCPVCQMKMKEYTIDEVKANLTKHGYEYK